MNFGWVKLHRTLVEWEWYGDIITRGIFIHCLIRCNHSDANWRGIEVKKGQFITSYNSLADENGVSIQTIRTHLKRLKKTGELTIKTTNKYTMITVCNYGSYQDSETADNKQTNKQANKQTTNKQQTTNRQLTTDKNDKKNNNNNNEKNFLEQQIKIEKKPNEIEKELRNYFNSNTDAKVSLFENLESGSGKTFTMDEKTAVVKRLTVFSNDYALRKNWDSNEATETKIIRFTNYILTSIQNGYELSSTAKPTASYKQEQKGYRVSPDFEKLIDEMAGGTKYF
jgi:biotin operon repressor